MNTALLFWRGVTIIGVFGLLGLIIIWNGWLAPVQQVPLWLELLLFGLPLALLARGILYGKAIAHVRATMISLAYTTISIWFILTPQEETYGYLMLLFSILLYAGGFFGAKYISKASETN
uniref:DUF2069 domain-containing protein n=1 Tax=uncultured Thiotrichaceae bacterium TaxID=298394 RepID=A0A6S6ULT4_9GAMM|nr:MAG: Unknown protein [uncultured Thiotrichaceae bacterium]